LQSVGITRTDSLRLYQIVGKKVRFPELPHVIAVLSERILHSPALETQFLHPNELQLPYKICWQADSIFFPVALTIFSTNCNLLS
jgi:hypothetical protein